MPRTRNQDDKIAEFFREAELPVAKTLFNVVKGIMARRLVPEVQKAPVKRRGPRTAKTPALECDPGKEN